MNRFTPMALALMAIAVGGRASVTRAEPLPMAGGRLRLGMDDALALLARQSPDTLSARLRVRAAEGDAITARLFPNPTLSVGVGNFALGETNPPGLSAGDTVVSQVGLSEELPLWGKRGRRMEAAAGRLAQAEADRTDLERRLRFELRSRFTDLLAADERLRLAREQRDRFADTVHVSEERAHTGDISPADFDRIALEQRSFEKEVADAETDRRDAVAAILPLIGVDAADIEPVGTLAVPEAPADVDRLVADALARRPDLAAARHAADAADAALRLAHAEAWPNPTVGLQYTHSEFLVSGDLRDQIGGTLSVPLPVADRNQGNIVRAEAEALTAKHDVERLQLVVPQEVRTAVTQYTTARGRVRRFAEAFVRQAHDARAAAEASYHDGAISLLELLEAERSDVQTRRDHVDALRDAATAAWAITSAAALEDTP